MGVKGLLSLIKEKGVCNCGTRIKVEQGMVFVFDGNGFTHWICNRDREEWPCPLVDVDYAVLRRKVIELLDQFKEAGATCVFVFDSFAEHDKLGTKIRRMREQVKDLEALEEEVNAAVTLASEVQVKLNTTTHHIHSLPLLAISCVYETLRETGVEAWFAAGEADEALVQTALARDAAGIVSSDTDMLAFYAREKDTVTTTIAARGLILLHDGLSYDADNRELFAQRIEPSRIAALLGVAQHQLCRVAALCGYDNSDSNTLSKTLAFLPAAASSSRGSNGGGGGSKGGRKNGKSKDKSKSKTKSKAKGDSVDKPTPPNQQQQQQHDGGETAAHITESQALEREVHCWVAVANAATAHKSHSTTTNKNNKKPLSALQTLRLAAQVVRLYSHSEDSSWMHPVVEGAHTPPGLDEEVHRSEEYYRVRYQTHPPQVVTYPPAPPLTSPQPVPTAWVQVVHSGVYLDGVWRLFSPDSDANCKAALRRVRTRLYPLLIQQQRQQQPIGSVDTAPPGAAVVVVVEVGELRGVLVTDSCQVVVSADGVDDNGNGDGCVAPATVSPAKLLECLCDGLDGVSGGDVDTAAPPLFTRGDLVSCSTALLRSLMRYLPDYPEHRREQRSQAFRALLEASTSTRPPNVSSSSKQSVSQPQPQPTTRTALEVDEWTIAQLAVQYANLASCAAGSNLRLEASALTRRLW